MSVCSIINVIQWVDGLNANASLCFVSYVFKQRVSLPEERQLATGKRAVEYFLDWSDV